MNFSMDSLVVERTLVFVTWVMIVTRPDAWTFSQAQFERTSGVHCKCNTAKIRMMVFQAKTRSISSPCFLVPRFEPLLACINTFAHLQRQPLILVAMPVTPSSPPSEPSQDLIPEAAEILRLKRRLAATYQELDEARGSRPKKIPWV